MKNTRIVAVVVGLLLLLPRLGLLVGGTSLGLASAFGRDESGYRVKVPADGQDEAPPSPTPAGDPTLRSSSANTSSREHRS